VVAGPVARAEEDVTLAHGLAGGLEEGVALVREALEVLALAQELAGGVVEAV